MDKFEAEDILNRMDKDKMDVLEVEKGGSREPIRFVEKATLYDSDGKKVWSEFGCMEPIRFAEAATLYDSDGKEVLCECGKPAVTGLVGTESFINWCHECAPGNKDDNCEHNFIYNPPPRKEDESGDAWTVDLKIKE